MGDVGASGAAALRTVRSIRRALLSEPQAREALQRLSDLINVYHAAPPQGVSFGSMLPSMGLPWIETTFNLENIDGLDYAMVPQPSGDERYSAMGVRLVGVVKGSEQERLAYELAKYMSTDLEAQRLLAVRKVSWVRSIATDPDYLETPPGRNKQSVVEAIQHAEPIYPLTSHWAELEPLLQAHVLPALRGRSSGGNGHGRSRPHRRHDFERRVKTRRRHCVKRHSYHQTKHRIPVCRSVDAFGLGCMGNPDVLTPNLDRLASEGVVFENTYSNWPVCTPFAAS